MKSIKPDETQINISVIGLSGSESVKGIYGIGKSCLCNRLAQPDFYKHKHISIISSIDFYGSLINQSHWLYWNYIQKEIRGKKYVFHFVEQTIFIDDSSFQEFKTNIEPQDFVKRAVMTELRINKKAYICNQKTDKIDSFILNSEDKFSIHLFLLVYDVSEVEKRNIKQQEIVFKQLFDSVISSKRPVIITTTKNDIKSQIILDRFRAIVDKKPYNKFPIVETSAKLNINFNHIYDLSVALCDNGIKNPKQILWSYSEGFINHEKQDEIYKNEFINLIENILESDDIFISWDEFIKNEKVSFYVERLPLNDLLPLFNTIQQHLMLKRRGINNRRFKEILHSILKESEYLIPLQKLSTEEIVRILKNENAFITHFIDYNGQMESFKFDKKFPHSKSLPLCLLDPEYENNLLFFIDEYFQQRYLEYMLSDHLLEDCQKYFRKPIKDIHYELTRYFKQFIPDKVIRNVYEKFNNYYLSILQSQFLDVIHENTNTFLSQNIFKFIDISPFKPWTGNDLFYSNKIVNEKKSTDNSFLWKMIKEINKLMKFDELLISDDENNIREEWIRNYLAFLSSKDEFECIMEAVCDIPCICKQIKKVLSYDISTIQIDANKDSSHLFYILILGNETRKSNFRNIVLSRISSLPLKICKIHLIKYQVEIITDLDIFKEVFATLTVKDKCSLICVVFLVDDIDDLEPLVNNFEKSVLNNESGILLIRYILSNIDFMFTGLPSCEFNNFLERNKYIVKPSFLENDHHTIDWIVSNAQKHTEQIIIWVVMVCGDSYDHQSVIKLILECMKEFFESIQLDLDTVSVIRIDNEIIIQNYHLVFVSYHQVIKLMIQSSAPLTVDAMIFVCLSNRLASVNTCEAIKKYLPIDISSSCHFMFICIGNELHLNSKQFQTKFSKCDIEYGFYNIDDSNIDSNESIKSKLTNFFKGIFNNYGTLKSFNSILSNSSSSIMNTNTTDNNSSRQFSESILCQKCNDLYKSDVNYSNSMGNIQKNTSIDYDEVLGTTNENIKETSSYQTSQNTANQVDIPQSSQLVPCHVDISKRKISDNERALNLFNFWSPEFLFDGVQDVGKKFTEVKCKLHLCSDAQKSNVKSFRIRILSQSDPDIHNYMDDNEISEEILLNCFHCGQDLKKTSISHSNRHSFRLSRKNGAKVVTQKTFTSKLHDLFNPIRKISDQIPDSKKSFIRSSSKRNK